MNLWELKCIINGVDYIDIEFHYFLTKELAEQFKITFKKSNLENCSIEYQLNKVKYEDIKCKLTITQYEELFKTTIESNAKLTVDDFKEGMWVWNDTEGVYQQLRYILIKNDYCWVDGYGRNIENDDIYRYQINEN